MRQTFGSYRTKTEVFNPATSAKKALTWQEYVRMLETLELKILQHWARSEDLEYYLNRGIELKYAQCLQFASALLRFTAYHNTITKVSKLNIEGIRTAKELKNVLVSLINHKVDQNECVKGLTSSGVAIAVGTLDRKVRAFKRCDYSLDTLIHGNYKNKHSEKLTPLAKKLLLSLYANKGKDTQLAIPKVYRKYIRLTQGALELTDTDTGEVFNRETKGLPKISLSTVRNFLIHPHTDIITLRLREGIKKLNDTHLPWLGREKVPHSLGLVSSDGHQIGLYLREGNEDTWKRLTAYTVFDVHSGAIVGYEIGKSETDVKGKKGPRKMAEGEQEEFWEVGLDTMMKAFQKTIKGANYTIPHEVQLDNKGRSHKKELDRLMPFVTFGKPNKSQDRYAERLIGQLEEAHFSDIVGWTGRNIKGARKSNGRRNPDFKRTCYTEPQIRKIFEKIVQEWNNTTPEGSAKTRLEAFKENIDPSCKKLSNRTYMEVFGSEARIESIKRGKINVQVDNVKYTFLVPRWYDVARDIKSGNDRRVRLRFDERSLQTPGKSTAHIYNFSPIEPKDKGLDTYLAEVILEEKAQGAKAYQTNQDLNVIGQASRAKEEMLGYIEAQEAEIADLRNTDMTSAEAEAILAAGYNETGKDLTNLANEAIHRDEDEEGQATKKFNPFRRNRDESSGDNENIL